MAIEPVAGTVADPLDLVRRLVGARAQHAGTAEPAGRVVEVEADDVGQPAGEPRIFGAPPPIMIGGPACWTGRGSPANPRRRRAHRARRSAPPTSGHAARRRTRRAWRCARRAAAIATPSPSYSSRTHPAPSPTSSRPSDSTSRVAISLASTTGWWKSQAKTRQPTRNVDVRAAAIAIDVSGAIDRAVTGGVRDRTRPEVVVGREQRGVAGVLGAPARCRTTRAPRRLRTPAGRTGTVALASSPPMIYLTMTLVTRTALDRVGRPDVLACSL